MSHNLSYFKKYGTSNSPYWQSSSREDADIATHSLLVCGDYVNTGLVGKANVLAILRDEELCERLGLYELCQIYDTSSIVIPIAALEDEEFQDILKALDDYPLLDEALYSELYSEAMTEAWDSYGRDDLREALGLHDLSDDETDSLFYEQYYDYANEEHGSIVFRFERAPKPNLKAVK